MSKTKIAATTKTEGESEETDPRLIERFRSLVNVYIERQQIGSALYWASKLVTLTKGLVVEDVLRLARCFLLSKQYHRAAHVIQVRKLDQTDLRCCYLAARAFYEANDFEQAFLIIENGSEIIEKVSEDLKKEGRGDSPESRRDLSSLLLLKGRVLEALDNRGLAAEAFKAALRHDVYCYEAFQALVQHQILTADEEADLIGALPYEEQCQEDRKVVKYLYEVSLKKYDKPADPGLPEALGCLSENTDILVTRAERYYYNCDYNECFKLTSRVIKEDPFHNDCLPIHITCMVELDKANNLFHLAHKLVDLYPEWCVSWFAVGCYYYLVGKHEPARRYLSKATQLDRVFGPAWLTYGHSFAMENEHDQAMAAYFKACQLMKGCHLPLLYIGVEYSLTNNPKLAERFFSEALSIAPKDPFVLHELGVIAFQNQDYVTAESYFLDALDRVQRIKGSVMSSKWESLLNNLGHCSRKLGKFKEALNFHQQALVLQPLTASTYSAIGYVHALMGNLMESVESFHKALGLRRDDTFSTTVLNSVIEQLMMGVAPFPDYPEDLPKFEVLKSTSHVETPPPLTTTASATKAVATTADHNNSSLSIDIDMTDVSEAGIMDQSS